MDFGAKDCNPKVIKIADDGAVTLSMPEVAGKYLVIEQEEGRIVLMPYDLRWHTPGGTIARIGSQLHVGPRLSKGLPEA